MKVFSQCKKLQSPQIIIIVSLNIQVKKFVSFQLSNMERKNFKILHLLGSGSTGKVFLVEKLDGKDKGMVYAMKVIEKDHAVRNSKSIESANTERKVTSDVMVIIITLQSTIF